MSLRNPLLCLRVPDELLFSDALTSKMRAALVAGKAGSDEEARAVMQAVAKSWEETIGTHAEEHARTYRQSLGLER